MRLECGRRASTCWWWGRQITATKLFLATWQRQSVLIMLRLWVIVSLFLVAGSVPVPQDYSFIGESTNELASELLKKHIAQNENMVYSPFGYNTLLAIFAEGARGVSREEIAAALHFPEDIQVVRENYQAVLKQLSEKYKDNKPEMKNWFYIYKNFTVEDNLKKVLREYYLTDVKSVDRLDDTDFKKDKTKVKIPAGLQGKPTDHLINVDKEVEEIIENASSPHKSDGEEAVSNNQPAMFDSNEKTENKPGETGSTESTVVDKEKEQEAAVFQQVLPGTANTNEKAQLSEEQVKQEAEEKRPSEDQNETKKKTETVQEAAVVPEKISEPIVESDDEKQKEDSSKGKEDVNKVEKEEELMVAMQRSFGDEDMNGRTDNFVKIKGKEYHSEMVVFNGLYFNGEWENQFVKRNADDTRAFIKSNKDKVYVKTIHGEGAFRSAKIPELSSRAIELKYKGGQYSLIVILPDAIDGLERLVSDLVDYPISKVCEQMTEKQVDVCLPTFEMMTITRPVPKSEKLVVSKVKSIFDQDSADLSGIAADKGLFVEDLVQAVGFEVDSKYTEANFLSASIASSRSDVDVEDFRVDHPFLFYLRDNTNGIILVNGKVIEPTPPVEERFNLKTHL